jgi:hypothetical protein
MTSGSENMAEPKKKLDLARQTLKTLKQKTGIKTGASDQLPAESNDTDSHTGKTGGVSCAYTPGM